jgi:hypothetical protein
VAEHQSLFQDALRLRDLSERQTLTRPENRELAAIADRVHAAGVAQVLIRDTGAQLRECDHLEYLSPNECAVILDEREADAVLAMLEQAHNVGMAPGLGLRVEDVRSAGFKLVSERFRDQDPYSRGLRLVATVARKASS